jgi:anthranilate synthase component 1
MQLFPDFDQFVKLAADHDRVPVARRLLSDSLTPVLAFHRLADAESACLFESVVGGEKVGRYSFLAIDPFLTLTAYGNQLTIDRNPRGGDQASVENFTAADPLNVLRQEVGKLRVAMIEGFPPFAGGAIGYAGYDVVRYVENLPDAPADDRQLPDLSFGFYDRMLVFDNVSKTLNVIVLADTSKQSPESAYRQAQQELDALATRVQNPQRNLAAEDIDVIGEPSLKYTSNFSKEQFASAVSKCVEYIRAGDIFQVVISQRLETQIHCDPFEIYRTLRVVNPSPFMFYLKTNETTLVGSSPEIMCRVVDGKVTVRPLAGTRRRGETEQRDAELEQELLADPKERAEHIMLVDLGRNDVGRVAQYGTIELPDIMVVERYSHVMHISSTVTGMLRDDCDSFDALAASLPAGTVSGAPKVRAMQIIDELEPNRRGPYAGAVGYVDFNGNMDTCIALRTLVMKGDIAYVQAGAGIVADSDPELEYEETLNKARGLLKAIEISEQRSRGA